MLTTVLFVRDLVTGAGGTGFSAQIVVLAVVHAAVRQPGRGRGRGPRQGAGRLLAAHPHRGQGQARGLGRGPQLARGLGPDPQARRPRAGRGRRPDPVRRRDRRGRGLGRRIGDHRRIGPGDPRERRRPLGGHRRHPRALRPDPGADHRRPGLDLHRPHDRPGRGCGPAEDAQRDRAQHPARRHDADLRPGRGQHPELRRLCRRLDPGHRAGGAVRHPDPDHDRRPALGHRHRRHGPPGPLQRAGHVGPRGRGRGRRRHAAARQDRHHHAGQPPGDRARSPMPGVPRPGAGRRGPARPACPTRRPRAARSSCWSRRSTGCGRARWRRCTRASSRSPRRPG